MIHINTNTTLHTKNIHTGPHTNINRHRRNYFHVSKISHPFIMNNEDNNKKKREKKEEEKNGKGNPKKR